MDRRAGFGGGAKPDFGAAARGVCYRPKCSRRGVTMQEPDTQGTPTTEVDTHVGCPRSPAREDRTWPLPICGVFSSIKGIQVLGKQENLNSITRIFTNSC